jgi:hypothetical protein
MMGKDCIWSRESWTGATGPHRGELSDGTTRREGSLLRKIHHVGGTELLEEPLEQDERNPYPYGDLFCSTCSTHSHDGAAQPGQHAGRADCPSPESLFEALSRDGNQWCALVGTGSAGRRGGFGNTVEEAIQALGAECDSESAVVAGVCVRATSPLIYWRLGRCA